MKLKFKPGDRVIVNTGGDDSKAIIDYSLFGGNYYMETFTCVYYCCRSTTDMSKTLFGGARSIPGSSDAKDNTLHKNAQFIDEPCIRLDSGYIETK